MPNLRFFNHQRPCLPRTFFRPRLATTPLCFANPSPPSGWVEDLHLQASAHTPRTLPGRDSSRPLVRRPARAERSLGAARKSACATLTRASDGPRSRARHGPIFDPQLNPTGKVIFEVTERSNKLGRGYFELSSRPLTRNS